MSSCREAILQWVLVSYISPLNVILCGFQDAFESRCILGPWLYLWPHNQPVTRPRPGFLFDRVCSGISQPRCSFQVGSGDFEGAVFPGAMVIVAATLGKLVLIP